MRRFSFSWSLAAEAIRLATFSCKEALGADRPVVRFDGASLCGTPHSRPADSALRHPHGGSSSSLLVLGWSIVGGPLPAKTPAAWWATLPLLAAILIRCGTVPGPLLADRLVRARLAWDRVALCGPLTGVYAAVRLVDAGGPGFDLDPGWSVRGWCQRFMPRVWRRSRRMPAGSLPICS